MYLTEFLYLVNQWAAKKSAVKSRVAMEKKMKDVQKEKQKGDNTTAKVLFENSPNEAMNDKQSTFVDKDNNKSKSNDEVIQNKNIAKEKNTTADVVKEETCRGTDASAAPAYEIADLALPVINDYSVRVRCPANARFARGPVMSNESMNKGSNLSLGKQIGGPMGPPTTKSSSPDAGASGSGSTSPTSLSSSQGAFGIEWGDWGGGGGDDAPVSDQCWIQLEEDLDEEVLKDLAKWWTPPESKSRWETQKNVSDSKQLEEHVVGEPLCVLLQLANPLSVPIQLRQVHLYGELVVEDHSSLNGRGTSASNEIENDNCATPRPRKGTEKTVEPPVAGLAQLRHISPVHGYRQRRRSKIVISDIDNLTIPPPTTFVGNRLRASSLGNTKSNTPLAYLDAEDYDLELKPNCKTVVRLAVTPRRPGLMRIFGVRWKLEGQYGGVWARHRFDLPGKRLNDTLVQRLKKARAPDLRLHRNVVASRPWLGVEVCNVPEVMIHGEICSFTMKLANYGNGPLSNLRMIFGCEPRKSFEIAIEDHHFLGFSGRLQKIPITQLEPGKSISITAQIRCSRCSGATDEAKLRLLFDYTCCSAKELAGHEENKRKNKWYKLMPRRRQVRIAETITVYPALRLTPYVRASYDSPGRYNFGVTVANVGPENIQLQNMRTFSPHWLTSLIETHNSEECTFLRSGEQSTFGLELQSIDEVRRRKENENVAETMKHSKMVVLKLDDNGQSNALSPFDYSEIESLDNKNRNIFVTDLSLQNDSKGTIANASLQFLLLENAGLVYDREHAKAIEDERVKREASEKSGPMGPREIRRFQEAQARAAGLKGHRPLPYTPAALFAMGEKGGEELYLTVQYRIAENKNPTESQLYVKTGSSNSLRMGALHLMRIPVRIAVSKTSVVQCPLTLSLIHPEEITLQRKGNFSGCSVDVGVRILNGALPGTKPINFAIEILEPTETLPIAGGNPGTAGTMTGSGPLRPRFYWSGFRRKKIENLAAGEEVQLKLKATFLHPGVYNLNRFRFVVDFAGQTQKPVTNIFVFPYQFLLAVKKNDDR
eukprot:g6506.t1